MSLRSSLPAAVGRKKTTNDYYGRTDHKRTLDAPYDSSVKVFLQPRTNRLVGRRWYSTWFSSDVSLLLRLPMLDASISRMVGFMAIVDLLSPIYDLSVRVQPSVGHRASIARRRTRAPPLISGRFRLTARPSASASVRQWRPILGTRLLRAYYEFHAGVTIDQ